MSKLLAPIPENSPARSRDTVDLTTIAPESLWLASFTSPNTRANHGRIVRRFIAVMGIADAEALYRVSQAQIVAYRDYLVESGYSQASIANQLAALSSLFRFLADKQLCRFNPVSGVKRPKGPGKGLGAGKTPALSAQDVRAMLEAPDTSKLQGLRDRAILHVYFYTGGRCSEPAKLRVKDFRFDREYWVLEFTVKSGKTNTVAIHSECQAAIRQYLDAAGHGQDKDAPLFQAVKVGKNKGGALSRSQFYEIFKRYARATSLPDNITPHSARTTFITEAYEAGWRGEDIQRTVGHSSITTTEGYNRTARRHRKSASFAVGY